MTDVPADAPFVWVALLLVSGAVLGVVLAMPSAPPPDADRVATEIDTVAASSYPSSATVPIEAEQVHLRQHSIGLRGAGGTAHAPIRYGPVFPVERGTRLDSVLTGASPRTVFDSEDAYHAALAGAAASDDHWRPSTGQVRIRRVSFGEVDSVLVGV